MNALLPPCEVLPHLLLTAAWGIAVALFVLTIKSDVPLPKWKWGDAPRRRNRCDRRFGPASIIAGAIGFVSAVSYAVQHPICG